MGGASPKKTQPSYHVLTELLALLNLDTRSLTPNWWLPFKGIGQPLERSEARRSRGRRRWRWWTPSGLRRSAAAAAPDALGRPPAAGVGADGGGRWGGGGSLFSGLYKGGMVDTERVDFCSLLLLGYWFFEAMVAK